MNEDNRGGPKLTSVEPERVEPRDPKQLAHLATNRGVIVKRSLMVTAVGAVIPVPVMDEYVAGRVRAGLLMKLAQLRNVDLPPSAAELMGDPREASMVRNATLTAITLVALKLAWRKIFALMAAGRGAEEMVSNFQYATLFDHYCATMHVGGPVDRQRAADLRKVMHATVERTEKATLTAIFRDGGKILGRSLLEAPRWVSLRLTSLAQRWVSTRGDVSATFDPAADVAPRGKTSGSTVPRRPWRAAGRPRVRTISRFSSRTSKPAGPSTRAMRQRAAKKAASAGASTGASPGETTPGDAGKSATETDTGGTPGGGRAN
jgi:hypothetical protein